MRESTPLWTRKPAEPRRRTCLARAVAQKRTEERALLGRGHARQQFRLLRRLIAAGNEDDVLDLISSM
jgi:hypothetical protein